MEAKMISGDEYAKLGDTCSEPYLVFTRGEDGAWFCFGDVAGLDMEARRAMKQMFRAVEKQMNSDFRIQIAGGKE